MLARVRVFLHYLWDRYRQRPRASALYAFRLRFLDQPPLPSSAVPALRQQAEELTQRRETLAQETGIVRSCASCAKGCPLPYGQWEGGFCCSGNTEELFGANELQGFRLQGLSPLSYKAPESEQSGCLFRGERGCSLPISHRPNICLTYICRDLGRELRDRPNAPELLALRDELEQRHEEYKEQLAHSLHSEPEGG